MPYDYTRRPLISWEREKYRSVQRDGERQIYLWAQTYRYGGKAIEEASGLRVIDSCWDPRLAAAAVRMHKRSPRKTRQEVFLFTIA